MHDGETYTLEVSLVGQSGYQLVESIRPRREVLSLTQ